MIELPPLSLYIHYPWCIKKCPYCDFNSHLKQNIDDLDYINSLIINLENSLEWLQNREIQSIFIGGGTPSLCSVEAMGKLFKVLKDKLQFATDIEITLEANPGASEVDKFIAFREIGINRLSIGVQSFDDKFLNFLGRVHTSEQAINAVLMAQNAGFEKINIDLMFALENQNIKQSLDDIKQAISLKPNHISFYQLTIEPNTLFAKNPPKISDEISWQMAQQGREELAKYGYKQYEVSAYAKDGQMAKHNLNYWQFGDYLGIGAGAHGKITMDNKIFRTRELKSPKDYISTNNTKIELVEDIAFEFMLNSLRLKQGFLIDIFEKRTGLTIDNIKKPLEKAIKLGLLELSENTIKTTKKGFDFLNDTQELFIV